MYSYPRRDTGGSFCILIQIILVNLISKGFSHKDDFDAVLIAASSCDNNLIADAVGRKAIGASAGCGTWGIFMKTDTVWRGSLTANPVHTVFHGRNHFVDSDNENDLFRTIDEGSNAVAVSVDID